MFNLLCNALHEIVILVDSVVAFLSNIVMFLNNTLFMLSITERIVIAAVRCKMFEKLSSESNQKI